MIYVFYLKCNRKGSDEIFYLWANSDNLKEWCISSVPCYFKDYGIANKLLEIVLKNKGKLTNLEILKTNK